MSPSPTSMQPTSPPPTIPPRSKCARMARAFSADHNCSGGANIGELLVNQSALSDTARISQLHSHFCSSQSCFDQYVNTIRACMVDVSGSRRNVTARKLVRLHAHILSNLCIHLDKFMQIQILLITFKKVLRRGFMWCLNSLQHCSYCRLYRVSTEQRCPLRGRYTVLRRMDSFVPYNFQKFLTVT